MAVVWRRTDIFSPYVVASTGKLDDVGEKKPCVNYLTITACSHENEKSSSLRVCLFGDTRREILRQYGMYILITSYMVRIDHQKTIYKDRN